MAKKELTEEGARALIQILTRSEARGIHYAVKHFLTGHGFLKREGSGIRTKYTVTAKGIRTLEREYTGAMEAAGFFPPTDRRFPVNRQSVLITEEQARRVFEAADVCLSEGIGPDMVDILQALSDAFPDIAADDGCQSTLRWMGGEDVQS